MKNIQLITGLGIAFLAAACMLLAISIRDLRIEWNNDLTSILRRIEDNTDDINSAALQIICNRYGGKSIVNYDGYKDTGIDGVFVYRLDEHQKSYGCIIKENKEDVYYRYENNELIASKEKVLR